jgi:hypothetical protein
MVSQFSLSFFSLDDVYLMCCTLVRPRNTNHMYFSCSSWPVGSLTLLKKHLLCLLQRGFWCRFRKLIPLCDKIFNHLYYISIGCYGPTKKSIYSVGCLGEFTDATLIGLFLCFRARRLCGTWATIGFSAWRRSTSLSCCAHTMATTHTRIGIREQEVVRGQSLRELKYIISLLFSLLCTHRC